MELLELLEANANTIVTDALTTLRSAKLQHYEAAGPPAIRARLQALYDVTLTCLRTRNLAPMEAHADAIARERHPAGFDLGEVQAAFNALEEVLWRRIQADGRPEDLAMSLGLVSTVLGDGKDRLARSYVELATHAHLPAIDMRALFRTPSA